MASAESFAAVLAAAMARSELSNAAVFRLAGLDESHGYKLLRGEVPNPQPATVKKLAKALEAPELLAFIRRESRADLTARVDRLEERLDRLLALVRELREDRPVPPS